MTVTDLITHLAAIKAEHGDLTAVQVDIHRPGYPVTDGCEVVALTRLSAGFYDMPDGSEPIEPVLTLRA